MNFATTAWGAALVVWVWVSWRYGWVDAVASRTVRWYRRLDRRVGGDGPAVLVFFGVSALGLSPVFGWWLVAPGAAAVTAGWWSARRRMERRVRRLESAVLAARHDAVVAAVRREMGALRSDLSVQISEAVETLLDEPIQ